MKGLKIACVLLVAFCLFLGGCTKEIEKIVYKSNPGDDGYGTIVGKVLQKDSQAKVIVRQAVIIDSTWIDSTDGTFRIDSLQAGNYEVVIIADHYGTYRVPDVWVNSGAVSYVGEIELSRYPDLIHSHYPDNREEIVLYWYHGWYGRYSSIRIIINFTEPMDRQSVEEAFSTIPSTEGTFYWSQRIYEPYSRWSGAYSSSSLGGGGYQSAELTTYSHIRSMMYILNQRYCWVDTTYQVILSTAAHDTLGNHLEFPLQFSFSTVESRTTLTSIQTDPEDGAQDVSLRHYMSIFITFPKRMDPTSVENAISITPQTEFGEVFLWPEANELKIYTGGPLMADTTYIIRIDSTAKDLDGNPLDEPFQFSFRTEPVRIRKTSPQNGEIYVDRWPKIYIYFNTYMIRSTLPGAFSILPSVEGNFYWDDDDPTKVYFRPQGTSLLPNTKYTVTIDTTVLDLHGTPLKEPYQFSFVTRPE
ncbi:Ig-like domain-containing protein [bacterium]|nr:Ig-like domain-containing protein [bacterium]